MHQSAMFYGRRFFEVYCPPSPPSGFTVVEIGSQDVNGSLRDACPAGVNYVGLDFVDGPGVDVVLDDPYALPLATESADVVVSSSCFEHSQFFWLVFLEAMRVLKPDGLFYLNAPSNGFFHRWPVDCWRFYPDAGHAMAAWGRRNGYRTALLESFVGQRSQGSVGEGGMWNDFVAVFLKDDRLQNRHPRRIVHALSDFTNGYANDADGVLRHSERGPDFALIEEQAHRLSLQESQITDLAQRLDASERALQTMRQQLDEALRAADKMRRSSSWRMTAPYRALRDLTRPPLRAIERSDLLYRMVTSPLMLLAYLAYNGNRHGFYKSWRRQSGFVARMISVQQLVRDRLLERGPTYRSLASIGFAIAVRVHESDGVFRALRRCRRILRKEGLAGVGAWLRGAMPGFATPVSPRRSPDAAPAPLPAAVARRILVADYRVPRADVSAGERGTVGILGDLRALGFDVTFLANDMQASPVYEADLRRIGIDVVTGRSGHQTAAQYLEQHGAGFGVFYFFRVNVAEALLPVAHRVAPHARMIFHAPDVYFIREAREAALTRDAAAHERAMATRNREIAMMRQSDHVVVVSPDELEVLRPELPDTPISVFPNLYAPVVAEPPSFEDRRHIFFLGGFGHPPNVDAVQWFVTEVWPLVRGGLPDAQFHVIGAEVPASVQALGRVPGVRVIGYVADLDPVLATMRVGIAPLRYGAGIKGKVAMTMGAGIPCVCTGIAAEGMGIEAGVHALVVDDAGAFADAVVALYRDQPLWERLSRNGRALVADRFGHAANRTALLQVLNDARVLPLDLFSGYCKQLKPQVLPRLADTDSVDVSIVVPVYNKWDLTRACLSSVIETSRGSGVSYEIILADDGSSDETLRAAEIFPGLRVIRTPANLGFLRNCNHAAPHARGRYLLFLNNDTVVLPGWLKALYGAVESDPTIAVVGSKLLYVDGRIQEAGGGLLNDAGRVSIGREVVVKGRIEPGGRDDPPFNVVRETDYVSGASMLVRRSFWDAVGGFDNRYQPAYCEDSDLAMAARSRGLRVIYQPASEVVHFEHQSYAEQAQANHLQLMAQHGRLLFDKWKEAFERDHLPAGSPWYQVAAHGDRTASPVARERRRSGRLNVLYFSPFPSHPSNHGNQATIQQFGRRFQSLGHKVHFALLDSRMYSPSDLEAMRRQWDSVDVLPNDRILWAEGNPIPFDGWYPEGLGERIAVLCARYDIDVVFCSYVFQSKLLEFVPAHILKVIDTHDKMGDRYEMLRANGQPLEFFSCTPQEEGAYLRRADIVVARREEEARYFDSVTGRASSIVVPHIEDPCPVERRFDSLHHVGIVASANRINLAIVQECLQAIDRTLAGRDCPFVVHVAGEVKKLVSELPATQAAVFSEPWVRLHGFVPDIADFYRAMDAIVSPVTMGTGINVKTVQAMAYGMPLVSTAWGIKGIETDEPLHNHQNLDDLARSLLELHRHPEHLDRLASLSRQRYQQFFLRGLDAIAGIFSHPKMIGTTLASDCCMATRGVTG